MKHRAQSQREREREREILMNWISKLAAMSYELHSLRLRFATELCTASPLFIYNCIRKKTKKAGEI